MAHNKESDREKIEYIYGEYRQFMLTKAFNILKDRPRAENALYESFLQIWKNIDKIDDPRSSQAIVLVITIVRNCSYALMGDAAQAAKTAKGIRDFNAAGIEEALYVMPASAIIKVVDKLGGENKNIFLLKYAYKFSRRKIASTLSDTEANVAARLRKTQKRLRSLLLRGEF